MTPPPANPSDDRPDAPREVPSALDLEMMRRSLLLAARAAGLGEVPVGAVVYTSDGRVLGEGFNQRESLHDPAAHAEFLAIREACAALGDWRLNDCSLAVTLEPCCMCAGLIVNARVGRLLYGCADPKAGGVESLYRLTADPRLNHRVAPITGVLAAEASDLLKTFFKSLRSR
ncbi:MAG: nucleoside deaminase [Phycisphaeraceae bacterium]|nr:nucleoside deaminase [Phycisphaeraceae bacterium]